MQDGDESIESESESSSSSDSCELGSSASEDTVSERSNQKSTEVSVVKNTPSGKPGPASLKAMLADQVTKQRQVNMSIIAKSNPGLHKKYQELDAAFANISTPKTMGSLSNQHDQKRQSTQPMSCGIAIMQNSKNESKRISAPMPIKKDEEEDVPEFMRVLKNLKPSPRQNNEGNGQ